MFKQPTYLTWLADQNRKVLLLSLRSILPILPMTALAMAIVFMPLAIYVAATEEGVRSGIGLIGALAYASVTLSILMSAMLIKVHAVATGEKTSNIDAFKRAILRCPVVACGSFIYVFLVSCGAILLVIPGFILFFRLSLWWSEVIINGSGIRSAFSNSLGMTNGRVWRLLCLGSMILAVDRAVTMAVDKLCSYLPEVAATLILPLPLILSMIFISAYLVRIHLDCNEHLDARLRLMAPA